MPVIPIETAHLFPKLEDKLIELLKSLAPDDWNKPAVDSWTVKDVAAHLLDGNVRCLSMLRDNYWGMKAPEVKSFNELTGWLNQINAEWVAAMKRASPAMLIQMHELTSPQFCEYIASLPPFEKAVFSVAWAGEEESLNWMHIAREYTERWHHQQQIREAVNKPGIMTKELFRPFIKTYMLALPYTYRNISAPDGTCVKIEVAGEIGGVWILRKEKDGWKLKEHDGTKPASEVIITPSIAWRLFSKNIRAKDVESGVTITGDAQLGSAALEMVSVMA